MDMTKIHEALEAFTEESKKAMMEEIEKAVEAAEEEHKECKVSLLEYENVLKTLPLSYYAGRPLTATLEEHADTSYYDPIADEITISYDVMKDAFQKLQYPEEVEELTRGMLYHEVSHALLSPSSLFKDCNQLKSHVMNIFEDERIETILRDYYLGVNFKKNVVLLNDYHGEQAESAMQEFYNTVRFRNGEEEYVKEVQFLIDKYFQIDNELNYDSWSGREYPMWDSEVRDYQDDVFKLLIKIAKKWYQKNKKQDLDDKAKQKAGTDFNNASQTVQDQIVSDMLAEENKGLNQKVIILVEGDGQSGDSEGQGAGKSGDGGSEEEKEKMLGIAESAEEKQNVGDTGKGAGGKTGAEQQGGRGAGDGARNAQKMLETVLNRHENPDLTKKIAEIFEQFTAREKNQGAAMRRYSGIMNPRNLTRDDWRIWEYKSQTGPIKGYDKLHLNLFIDTSGSFSGNIAKTNELLRSLINLEQKYPYFDFDLVTCEVGENLRTKKERHVQAGGGTDLDDDIWDIYAKLQRRDSFNYNIVLFDGYAFNRSQHEKNFGAFNNSKCSIITDADNQGAAEKYAPNARLIIVKRNSRKSYAELLHENVITVLQRALM